MYTFICVNEHLITCITAMRTKGVLTGQKICNVPQDLVMVGRKIDAVRQQLAVCPHTTGQEGHGKNGFNRHRLLHREKERGGGGKGFNHMGLWSESRTIDFDIN